MAYDVIHFERAARILLKFAEAEEHNRTDARNAWKELFHLVLSGTLALPAQRAALLRELFQDERSKVRQLAADGVSAMLKSAYFSASHDFTFGARSRSYGWEPTSQDDFLAWYGTAFTLVRELGLHGGESREAVRTALAGELRSLWQHDVLRRQLAELIRDLADADGWPSGWVAVRSALRFNGAGMPSGALAALKELEALLSPKSLRQQILSYSLGHPYGALDIADGEDADEEAEDGNPVSAHERVDERTVSLGEAVAANQEVLADVLPDLLLAPDGRQQAFGFGLGKATKTPGQTWQLIYGIYSTLDAECRNSSLLSGFLRGVRVSNMDVATELLDSLVVDPILGPVFPYIQGWPLNDAEGDRLLRAIEHGATTARRLFFGVAHQGGSGLSVEKFCEVALRVAAMQDGLNVAMYSLSMEYHRFKHLKTEIPQSLVLLGRQLLSAFRFDSSDHNLGYRLKEVAKVSLRDSDAASAARVFATRFAEALDDYRTHADAYGDLACVLFKLHPTIALDAFLSRPASKRLFPIRARFELTRDRIVECASAEAILDWVATAPDERLLLVGTEIEVLDKTSLDEPRLSDLATRLLAMANDKRTLLEAFGRRFNPSGWSGSLEQTLRPYMALAGRLSEDSSPEVATWAIRQLDAMKRRIAADERAERQAEERFE